MNDIVARIKFNNKNWLVFDSFIYEGTKYMYIGSEDTANELEKVESIEEYNGKVELEFIYELSNKNYKNVTDQELISKLFEVVVNRQLKQLK